MYYISHPYSKNIIIARNADLRIKTPSYIHLLDVYSEYMQIQIAKAKSFSSISIASGLRGFGIPGTAKYSLGN